MAITSSTPDGAIIFPPDLIVTSAGGGLGRGVYAARAFKAGELIEVASVVELAVDWDTLPKPLQTRVFNWKYLTNSDNQLALAMGFGSLYNHSESANARFEGDRQHSVMRYIATRDIAENEQVLINYNQSILNDSPREENWFDLNDIPEIE
jgi:uncharacterized protein